MSSQPEEPHPPLGSLSLPLYPHPPEQLRFLYTLLKVAKRLIHEKPGRQHPKPAAFNPTSLVKPYPLFTLLFSYLLFGENQSNWAVFVGGLLVITGVGIIGCFS